MVFTCFFPLGRVDMYTVSIVLFPETLVKTLAKNLTKNLAKKNVFWTVFGQFVKRFFGQICDQTFGQGFDQDLGEEKTINTMYSTTRPQGQTIKNHLKKTVKSKLILCYSLILRSPEGSKRCRGRVRIICTKFRSNPTMGEIVVIEEANILTTIKLTCIKV